MLNVSNLVLSIVHSLAQDLTAHHLIGLYAFFAHIIYGLCETIRVFIHEQASAAGAWTRFLITTAIALAIYFLALLHLLEYIAAA